MYEMNITNKATEESAFLLIDKVYSN